MRSFFYISAALTLLYAFPAGDRYRLVQAAQEHGSADDVQRKAHPREAEDLPVQSSYDLSSTNTQQRNTSRLNPQDGVRRLHLTQQVGVLNLIVLFFFFFLQCRIIMLSNITASPDHGVCSCSSSRRFTNVPVLVNNLGLLEQLSYWKVSAPCSAAGYSLTMKKHGSANAHIQVFLFFKHLRKIMKHVFFFFLLQP